MIPYARLWVCFTKGYKLIQHQIWLLKARSNPESNAFQAFNFTFTGPWDIWNHSVLRNMPLKIPVATTHVRNNSKYVFDSSA